MYQMFRGLAYVHSMNVCHRDVKPQNLLCSPENGVLKLCDLGSSKLLNQADPNVTYVCSRYYRAPELILCSPACTVSIGERMKFIQIWTN